MWNLDPTIHNGGPRTWGEKNENLKFYAKVIPKNKLKRNDIIFLENKHVILFDKWCDKKNKNKYYGYEVCNIPKCKGFKYHKILFPYNLKVRPLLSY